jgi:hypothetical protein
MHSSVMGIDDDFVDKVQKKYRNWNEVAKEFDVDFIPNVMPGFDDTNVRPEENHPVINRSEEKFKYFCEISQDFIDSDINMVLLTSYNEWHEYTQIESSVEYRNKYLMIIRDAYN